MKSALKKLEEIRYETGRSVFDLMHGMRQEPALRSWLPSESYLLPPIPARYDRKKSLIVPVAATAGHGFISPPWGAIEHTWPGSRLAQLLDLRLHPEAGKLYKKLSPIGLPKLKADQKARLETELYQKLQVIFESGRDEFNPDALLDLYNKLVPEAIVPFYWTLNPSSKTWFSPSPEPTRSHKALTKPAEPEQAQPAGPNPQDGLGESLTRWFQSAEKLAQTSGNAGFVDELHELSDRINLAGFRLALVGAFNSGKSTLINTLLQRELLPTDPWPTTGAITSICAGKKEMARACESGSWGEAVELSKFSWKGLKASDPGFKNTNIPMPKVKLSINDNWLSELDLEIIDTPGINDRSDHWELSTYRLNQQSASAYRILTQCDGVIMVVSQFDAHSLVGKAFIKEEILGRNIAARFVAVTKLDSIPEEDNPDAYIEDVSRRMHAIDESLKVIPIYPNKGSGEEHALKDLRNEISKMVKNGDHQIWRKRQVAAAIADITGRIEALAHTRLEAVQMNSTDLDQEKRQAGWAIEEAKTNWGDLEIMFQNRRQSVLTEVKTRIEAVQLEIVNDLEYGLNQTADPVKWWDKTLPHILQKTLDKLSHELESLVLARLSNDYDWMNRQVETKFKAHIAVGSQNVVSFKKVEINTANAAMDDLRKKRLFTRIGAGSATMLGYLVFSPLVGPLAMIAPLTAMIASEEFLNKKIEGQRDKLMANVGKEVGNVLDGFLKDVEKNIRKLYRNITTAMQQEMMAWIENRKSALNRPAEPSDTAGLKKLADECADLRKEIVGYLD